MTPQHWQQVKHVFQSAIQYPPERRAAFLDEACANNPTLRGEVDSLISSYDQGDDSIEALAGDVAVQVLADDRGSLIGKNIGSYKILSEIGSGAMGNVFLAHDPRLNRRVALKVLPAEFAQNQDRLRRFHREARAVSALNHPNILTIHEVGQIDSLNFIVSEFIEGETLRNRMRCQKPLLHEALGIAIQIASALAAAHKAGIVHRDVKPENIMLREDGIVKVLDFGLAKLTQLQLSTTDTEAPTLGNLTTDPGTMMGTVNYMSPEQARGLNVDECTDIFSLGVLIYEMVTGKRPFEGATSSDVIASLLTKQPAPMVSHVSDVPAELENIVRKCLEKYCDNRYRSARDLLINLERLANRELLVDLSNLKHHLEFEEELERNLPRDIGAGGEYPLVIAANEPPDVGRLAGTQAGPSAADRQREIKRKAPGLIVAALVIVIATLTYLFYFPPFHPSSKVIDSIAVLPLVNAGNDPETDYLSDGITDSLINSLSQFSQLRVVARTTAFRYKGKEIDPQRVGRDLGVQAVLTGRLTQLGDMLALQVDLVETSNGSQVWGEQYDRKASDVLVVKQELTREISEKLRLRLIGEGEKRLTRGDASNAEAYQLYLKGRHFWNRRTPASLKKAIEQFQQAIDHDPNYGLAYVGLADCYVLLGEYAGTPSRETLPKARAAVERALEIDDSLGEAHASLGSLEMFSWNFGEAEREFRRAIELNPNYATAHHWYSYYLRLIKGRLDEAMVEIRLAQQLDPLSPVISNNVTLIHLTRGELDAAIEASKKVLELDSNFPGAHSTLSIAYWRLGRYEEAIAESETGIELSGRQSLYLAELGVCYALAGKRERARAILIELEDRFSRRQASGQILAAMYAALGDKERSFAYLEKDFQARSVLLPIFAYDPGGGDILRDELSSDPRWNDLRRRIGLPN